MFNRFVHAVAVTAMLLSLNTTAIPDTKSGFPNLVPIARRRSVYYTRAGVDAASSAQKCVITL